MHSLLKCDIPKVVWCNCKNYLVNLDAFYGDFTDLDLQFTTSGTNQDLETFFVTAWSIWYNRNQIVHDSTPNQIWETAKRTLIDYKGALSSTLQQKTNPSTC